MTTEIYHNVENRVKSGNFGHQANLDSTLYV